MKLTAEYSQKTLRKTLKEWESGGTGEGGVDVVGHCYRLCRPRVVHGLSLGLRDDRVWNGDRQE